ncbi:hypothetical protein GQX73_g7514 [Xylaria multiplex]|uniref:Berberine/berberine-like domain-containing protein n=1 Tax=Xylaria multiplex TaxID=323545 RepID=A0A7C8IR20_9PEZI|nr:hypothetical protein GQX73_g7514 [Xylaria multiplex]
MAKIAIILWVFIYAGSKRDATPYLKPFKKLHYVLKQNENAPYTQITNIIESGLDSILCAPNQTHITTTTGLQVFNVTAQRQIYDLFNSKIAEHPELSGTRVTTEAYSVQGVTKNKGRKSSFSQRDEYILTYFGATNPQDFGLEDYAIQWAKETRDLWNAGQPGRRPTTYLNYAMGDEPLEAMYGYDGQLGRLRRLKRRYDPHNRFQYHNPIVPPNAY